MAKYLLPELPGSCRTLDGLMDFLADKDGRRKWWDSAKAMMAEAAATIAVATTLDEAETARLQAAADRAAAAAELKTARDKAKKRLDETDAKIKEAQAALMTDRARWEEQVAAEEERQKQLAARNNADRVVLTSALAEADSERKAASIAREAATKLESEWAARWAKLEAARV